ncbi:zinc-binding dehydrogenase [Edaphobacter aggregans]|uniref:zinc-binding dehydrogenase n=1 Tax=Edaphobacter aggregans TaxID=570835 RepID=UPI001B8023E4|nr:zinc-binding dehydrogenase [Edaphobacter aggregans]
MVFKQLKFGRISSHEKVAIAKEAGADHLIVDAEGQFAEEAIRHESWRGRACRLRRLRTTNLSGIAGCAPSIWNVLLVRPCSRWTGTINIMSLPKSIKIGYAVFFDHIHTPELFRTHSTKLFNWIAEGKLKVRIGGEYPLADAAKVLANMESRKTTGKLLLVP